MKHRFCHLLPDSLNLPIRWAKCGATYHLASAKVKDEKSGGIFFGTDKKIEMVYVGIDNLETKLEKLCSFSSLTPAKVVARLGEDIIIQLHTHLSTKCELAELYLLYELTRDNSFLYRHTQGISKVRQIMCYTLSSVTLRRSRKKDMKVCCIVLRCR